MERTPVRPEGLLVTRAMLRRFLVWTCQWGPKEADESTPGMWRHIAAALPAHHAWCDICSQPTGECSAPGRHNRKWVVSRAALCELDTTQLLPGSHAKMKTRRRIADFIIHLRVPPAR